MCSALSLLVNIIMPSSRRWPFFLLEFPYMTPVNTGETQTLSGPPQYTPREILTYVYIVHEVAIFAMAKINKQKSTQK